MFFTIQVEVLMLSQTAMDLQAYNLHKLSVQLPTEVVEAKIFRS